MIYQSTNIPIHMEEIYNEIAQRILAQVPEIAWIDIDQGQLANIELRAALAYPAVLIDIDFARCEDLGLSGQQICDANIVLKVVSQAWSDTHMHAPQDVRNMGLQHFILMRKIHKALQWWCPPHQSNLGSLRRTAARRENRTDGIAVHHAVYAANYHDTQSAHTPHTHLPGVMPNITM